MRGSSYPIWNAVTACIYKSSRSTTHRVLANGDKSFRFYVDNVCVRQATLAKGSKELVVTYAAIEPVPTHKPTDVEDAA